MGDRPQTRPGVLNDRGGLPADEMAERAREAGYFPEHGAPETQGQAARRADGGAESAETFTTRAFLEGLDDDLNGRPRFGPTIDGEGAGRAASMRDLERELADTGAAITDPPEVILAALREKRANPDAHADRARYESDPDNPPFYSGSPIGDPAAWRRYVGEPMADALRAISSGTANARAAAGRLLFNNALFASADSELRATRSAKASDTFRAELDGLHARAGEAGLLVAGWLGYATCDKPT